MTPGMATLNDEAKQRAIDWIGRELGGVSDLPQNTIRAIWVTVYRGMELGIIRAEAEGRYSSLEIMAARLKSVEAMDFIVEMVTVIRSAEGTADFDGNCGLFEYMLKWGHLEARYRSTIRKLWARMTSRPDPLFEAPIPAELVPAA